MKTHETHPGLASWSAVVECRSMKWNCWGALDSRTDWLGGCRGYQNRHQDNDH